MARKRFLFAPLAGLTMVGCAFFAAKPGLKLTDVEQEKVVRQFEGRDFVLASSLYVGEFFGQPERQLVDARPFEVLDWFHHEGKKVVVLPHSGQVIPAGTSVRIKEIKFPIDARTAALHSRDEGEHAPTAHTWVVLQPAEGADEKNREWVAVLPRKLEGQREFVTAMQERFRSPGWVSNWLDQRQPHVLDAIFAKQAIEGMSHAEVVAALGEPRNSKSQEELGTLEYVADYGDIQVTLEGDVVKKVISQREEAKARRERMLAEAEKRRIEEEKRQKELAERQKIAKAKAEAERKRAMEKQQAEATLAAKQRALEEEKRQREHAQQLRKLNQKAQEEAARKAALRLKREKELAVQLKKMESRASKEQRKFESLIKKQEGVIVAARNKLDARIAPKQNRLAKRRAEIQTEINLAQSAIDTSQELLNALGSKKGKLGAGLANAPKDGGAEVKHVTAGGPAYDAGIRKGDVIVSIDDAQVKDARTAIKTLSNLPAGKLARVGVVRNGDRLAFAVTMHKKDQARTAQRRRLESEIAANERKIATLKKELKTGIVAEEKKLQAQRARIDQEIAGAEAEIDRIRNRVPVAAVALNEPAIGVYYQSISPSLARRMGVSTNAGAYIAEVNRGSAAQRAGVQERDVVTSINDRPVRGAVDFGTMVGIATPKELLKFVVLREGQKLTLAVAPSANRDIPSPTQKAKVPRRRTKAKSAGDDLVAY